MCYLSKPVFLTSLNADLFKQAGCLCSALSNRLYCVVVTKQVHAPSGNRTGSDKIAVHCVALVRTCTPCSPYLTAKKVLGPTQPPTICLPDSKEEMQPGREADRPHLMSRLRMRGAITRLAHTSEKVYTGWSKSHADLSWHVIFVKNRLHWN
jgi:hypothetical protein